MVRFARRQPAGLGAGSPEGGPDHDGLQADVGTVARSAHPPSDPEPDAGRPAASGAAPRSEPSSAAGLEQRTEVLEPGRAAAVADPGAPTQALARAAPTVGPARQQGVVPLLSRRVAAEVGVYVGAGLVTLSVAGAASRGWPDWGSVARVASLVLAAVGLLAAGLFVRLPWSRALTDGRRRAVSTLLTAGVGLALAAAGLGLESPGSGAAIGLAGAAVLALLLVCVVARTPLSETALLGSLAWSAWLLAPSGAATWAALVGLGMAWVAVAVRVARGRRTAAVSGALLALACSVGLAQDSWAWPVRAALAAVVAAGLVMFLRGGPNAWLALGAGGAAALAASVAGGLLGPALALLVGGLATMTVSGIALRAASRTR